MAIIFYFFWSQPQDPVIHLTSDGFEPKELRVNLGETVTFINSSSNPFWPASDDHPTHMTYQSFDPRQPIAPGGSWTFTFDKSGTWKYHDHLSPFFNGLIVVKGKTQQIDPCEKDNTSFDCWSKQLKETMDSDGIEKAFDQLSNNYSAYPEFPEYCHSIAHELGHEAVKKYLEKPESIFTPKTTYCAYGFFHGFVESLINATDIKTAKSFCGTAGERLGKDAPDVYLQCYHGIGHAGVAQTLTAHSEYTEEALAKTALEFCEDASDTDDELYRCSSGVFNTIANFYTRQEFGLKPRIDDPIWFCHTQPDKYKESCYGNMNLVLNSVAENDFLKAAKFVEKIPEDRFATRAMMYLATANSSRLGKNDPEGAVLACGKIQNRLNLSCIQGFVYGFQENGTPNFSYQEALSFCGAKSLTETLREKCFEYALHSLRSIYSDTKVDQICSTEVQERYKKYCQRTK